MLIVFQSYKKNIALMMSLHNVRDRLHTVRSIDEERKVPLRLPFGLRRGWGSEGGAMFRDNALEVLKPDEHVEPHEPLQNLLISLALGISPINSPFIKLPSQPVLREVATAGSIVRLLLVVPLQEVVVVTEMRHPVRAVVARVVHLALLTFPHHSLFIMLVQVVVMPEVGAIK